MQIRAWICINVLVNFARARPKDRVHGRWSACSLRYNCPYRTVIAIYREVDTPQPERPPGASSLWRLQGAGDAAITEGSNLRPNRLSYRIGAAAIAAGLILVGSAPAYAAAPSNDTFAGAIPIGAVPFSTTLDTSEATTDAD